MNNKKVIVGCLIALNLVSVPVEAKAVVVTKITDNKATQAYIKQVQELAEIVKQTQQLQSQLENLQQSLQHFDFKDINQSCNFLLGTLDKMENIQNQVDVIGADCKTFEEDWETINKEYESDEVRDEALTELLNRRKKTLADSNKRSGMIAGLVNADDTRESINNVKHYLKIFDTAKTSPVKGLQAVGGILAQQIAETQTLQKIQAEQLRREALKEQVNLDKEAQEKAEAEANQKTIKQSLNKLKDTKPKYKYKSSVMTIDDINSPELNN